MNERQSIESAGADVVFRHPDESDHQRIIAVIDDWHGGDHMRARLPRIWLRHFSGTSWLAEVVGPDPVPGPGRLAGFLVGFQSPDRPGEAEIVVCAVNPNLRRRGIGRGLIERFVDQERAAAVTVVSMALPPDHHPAIAFLRAVGFAVDDGPGTRPLWGTPAHPHYEHEGADRAILRLRL